MCYFHRCFGRLEFQVQSRNSTLNSTSSKTNKHCFNLLLHFHSHTDKRYKDSLLKTMIHRACALSSATETFNAECVKLRSIFSQIALYFQSSSVINHFLYRNASAGIVKRNTDDSSTVRSSLPFKDQVAANAVQKRLHYCCNHLLKENQFRVLRKCRGKFDCQSLKCFSSRISSLILISRRIPYVPIFFFLITIVLFLRYSFLSPIVILVNIECNFFDFDNDVQPNID